MDNNQNDLYENNSDKDLTGQDEKTTGQDEETIGQDEGTTGQDEKTTGQDEGTTGQDEKTTGQDEETTGQDEKTTEAAKPRPPRRVSLGAAVFVVILASLITFMSTVIYMNDAPKAKEPAVTGGLDYTKLDYVDYLYKNYYVKPIENDELTSGLIAGYIYGAGDSYGEYYSAEEYASVQTDMNGSMVGIGVTVSYNNNYGTIEITNVYADSPAAKAGVLSGDLIVTVGEDKKSAVELGYTETVNEMLGEEGTLAVFSVLRGDNYTESVDFSIERAVIDQVTVTYRLYEADQTVGIIRISGFDKKTPAQFADAVAELQKQGAASLVFDIRYNPGGELNSICAILDSLLPEGPVIRTIDCDGNEKVIYESDSECINLPMAVLVNGNTASAAELFCSALMDYKVAKSVGTTTYGKGSIQSIMKLPDGSALKITTSYYCPPFSDCYDGIGITPDVAVEPGEALSEKGTHLVSDSEDNQLAAAVEALKQSNNN